MAAKGSRRALKAKKGELYLERFAFDVLSVTLPLCGLHKDKLKCKERNKNVYDDNNHVFNVSVIAINVALSMRDEWRTMFESRHKSSGLDVTQKIGEYLKTFLTICREFRFGNTSTKIKVSIATYSEMILFLNYKGIEFDFEQLIVLWSVHFMELITPQKEASESLQNLFDLPSDASVFLKWVKSFLQDFAIPYGHRNDVSEVFRQRLAQIKQNEYEKNFEFAKMLAHLTPQITKTAEPDPVLPPGFESQAVLPGDRESPEPPESCSFQTGIRAIDKESRQQSLRALGFEPLDVLPGDRESPESPEGCSFKTGVRGVHKEPRRRAARPLGTPGSESPCVLPRDVCLDMESPEPPADCSTKSVVRGKEGSRRQSPQLTELGRRKQFTE